MKRTLSVLLLAVCVMAVCAGPASAVHFDNRYAGIMLHIVPVVPPVPTNGCTITGLTNATMNVSEPTLTLDDTNGPFYFAYLLVCNGSDSTGIQGMECGIDYAGGYGTGFTPISVYEWRNCGSLEFSYTGWPAPGGSNIITWTDARCNKTASEPGVKYSVIAVGGYFYLGAYAAGTMYVIPRPVSGLAKVADCSAREDAISNYVPSHLGYAGWGGNAGYNPCGAPTPVENSTWGAVKSLYNNR
jgi:hypothetical protein